MFENIGVALITTVGVIINTLISNKTNRKIKKIDDLKEEFKSQIQDSEYERYKTYLVDYLSEVENGVKKTEIQKERASEIYDKYIKLGGNSYVKDKWKELQRKNLL